MGRIGKALSITSAIATGGVIGTPVRWESSAEQAAREQAQLMREQNELLANTARNVQDSAPDPVSAFEQRAQDLAARDIAIAIADIADPMLRSRVKRLRRR